jgi:glycosyltransferase involved in cell wall biosynthesis
MKRIAYIVFNESIFDNLIKTQVIELLKEINKKNIGNKIYLINFLPITKLFQIKRYLKNAKELKKNGIVYIFLPITLHSRLYFFNIFFPLFSFVYGKILSLILKFLNIDIIHCRSYFATLLAVYARKKERIIFDTRSLFIEENISIKKIKENSITHKLWEKFEKILLLKSDKIVVIDEIFIKKYLNKVKIDSKKFEVIPIFVNDDLIYYDENERKEIRKRLKIDKKEVYIYVGSFYGWNNIDEYFNYFKKIIEEKKEVFFIILTKQIDLVEKKIRDYNFDNKIFFYKTVDNSEIRKYLSAADYGVILMGKNKDSDTRLGVKFLEYLACNLKIITNSNVGLAAKITEENKIGINIDNKKYYFLKNKSADIYSKFFSKKIIVNKYIEVYNFLKKEV